jgi:hypothetical protein
VSGVVGNAEVGMAVGGVWEDSWGKRGYADWSPACFVFCGVGDSV